MTALKEILIRQIEREGAISVADYMTQCLFHPTHGYYTSRNPVGEKGDFITAPEVSQMFGEMIGLALVQSWMDQGQPDDCVLCELGPGNGTLMKDILRVAKTVPGFLDAAKIHLVEISPSLHATQKETLKEFNIQWVETVEALPAKPTFLVANEFFDCLPIRQFRKGAEGWQEQMIGAKDGTLHFMLGAKAPEISDETRDFIELCPSALALCNAISTQIGVNGGAGIIIDYGAAPPEGDTLQALKSHEKVDPLHEPGLCDLTAHVDFSALIKEASKTAHVPIPVTQGLYLERLGITDRAQKLAANLAGDALETIISQHRRLTHPDEMGTLFKVMGIVPNGAPVPPGFDA